LPAEVVDGGGRVAPKLKGKEFFCPPDVVEPPVDYGRGYCYTTRTFPPVYPLEVF
jgi:hypothetical protein